MIPSHQPRDEEIQMNEENYKYFVAGLRVAIKAAGYEHEKDFAKGIMSPQTLSRAMNLKSKLRSDNILAVLNRLNKSESDLILLGKEELNGAFYSEGPESIFPDWRADSLASLGRNELTKQFNSFYSAYTENIASYHKAAFKCIEGLVENRNAIIKERNDLSAILENISHAVKVLSKEKVVMYSNFAHRKLVGGDYTGQLCPQKCKNPEDCYVDKVFATGDEFMFLNLYDDNIYAVTYSPIYSDSGKILKVAAIARRLNESFYHDLKDFIKENKQALS